MAAALNRLAGRIDELLAAERESAADLSHRLRTPLTALRLDAEALPDPATATGCWPTSTRSSRGIDEVIAEARRPVREGLGAGCDAAAVVADRVRVLVGAGRGRGPRGHRRPGRGPAAGAAWPPADLGAAVDALLGNVFAHTPDGHGVRRRRAARARAAVPW